jgi:hypothetical protein
MLETALMTIQTNYEYNTSRTMVAMRGMLTQSILFYTKLQRERDLVFFLHFFFEFAQLLILI